MAKLPRPRTRREPERHPSSNGVWDWFTQWLPASGHTGVKAINEGTLFGVPAAWRCATFIANAVATCAPPTVHDGATQEDPNVPVQPTPHVAANPWPMLTPHEYWTGATLSVLLYGNFIGVPADFDEDTGYPRQVIPLHPAEVEFKMEDGFPTYRYGEMTWLAGEVLHVRANASPGQLWGLGVIQVHRTTLSESVDHQSYGINLYGGSAVPPWVVGVDDPTMTEDQAEKVSARMGKLREQGSKLPAVIPNNMTIETLAFSPADAQYLESKRWNATEIAWAFGMDPADLGVAMPGASLTYANIGERSIERLVHTVGPWIRRFEQAWSQFMLPGGQHMHFQEQNLLRLDPKTRTELLIAQQDAYLATTNEGRTALDRQRYTDAWADEPGGKPESAQMPAVLMQANQTDPPQEDDNDDDDDD